MEIYLGDGRNQESISVLPFIYQKLIVMIFIFFLCSVSLLSIFIFLQAKQENFAIRPLESTGGNLSEFPQIPANRIPSIIYSKFIGKPNITWISPIPLEDKKLRLKIELYKSLIALLRIFVTVTFFYSLVQIILIIYEYNLYISGIVGKIEAHINSVKAFLKNIEFLDEYDWAFFLLIILMTSIIMALEVYNLKDRFSKALKVYQKCLLIFTIMSSLTFFGIAVMNGESKRAEKMAFRRDEIIGQQKENVIRIYNIVNTEIVDAMIEYVGAYKLYNAMEDVKKKIKDETTSQFYSDLIIQLDKYKISQRPEIEVFESQLAIAFNLESQISKINAEFNKQYQRTHTNSSFDGVNNEYIYSELKNNNLFKCTVYLLHQIVKIASQ